MGDEAPLGPLKRVFDSSSLSCGFRSLEDVSLSLRALSDSRLTSQNFVDIPPVVLEERFLSGTDYERVPADRA